MKASRPSLSSSSSSCVDDIVNRISEIGIASNRIKQYKKNIVFSFSDGYIIAEVIHTMYPSLIDIKSFLDEGSEIARKANWDRLSKIFQRISMKLSKDEISAIVNRRIEKELVANFMFLLIDKLDEMRKSLPATVVSKENNKTNDSTKTNNNTTSTNTIGNTKSSSLKRTSVISSTNTLSTKTQSILEELERKKEVSRRTSLMSSKQLDDMYSRTMKTAREESKKITEAIDEMQKKSEIIDSEFRQLTTKNKEELVRTERRLSMLELEVKQIDNNDKYITELEEVYNDKYITHREEEEVKEVEEEVYNAASNDSGIKLSVFGFEKIEEDDQVVDDSVVTYTRVYSDDHNTYYYMNNVTQEVQWELPGVDDKYIIDYK